MEPASPAQPKFQRLEADERRRAMISATVDCLARLGPKSTSVREICKQAGVSPGLLRHYFDGKDDLFVQTYRWLTESFMDGMRETLVEKKGTAQERLDAFFQFCFSPEWISEDVLGVWIAFWSLNKTSPEIEAIHRSFYKAHRRTLASVLEELTAQKLDGEELREASMSLTALLDGLWLEHCLDPSSFSSETAVAMCRRWVARNLVEPSTA